MDQKKKNIIPSWPVIAQGLLTLVFCMILSVASHGQARLVLNGGTVNLNQGAYLVIDNPSSDAITRTSGQIISEGENNRLKWNIGVTTGTYTIPWGYGSSYIPVTFTKSAGSGSGNFVFSTYHTGWQNSSQLPTGVTNINGASGFDNSAFVSDRFWQLNAQGYTTKPTLSNLIFTYIDAENLDPNNSIQQSSLVAKRYNSTLASWTDNIPASTVNTTNNTVTVTSVSAADLQPWWIVGTTGENRYWVAPSNSTSNISANWSAAPGGPGNAGVPTSVDAVIFDGAMDANCTLTAPLTAATLIVNAGYTGTIAQGSQAININNAATFSGGTFLGGTSVINISGPFTLSGTAFTSTSGALDVKKNFTLQSGSFMHNNGTVRFSGATPAVTQYVGGPITATFNNIIVTNNTGNPGVIIESDQNLSGTLTLSNNVIFDADGTGNTAIFKLLSAGDNPTQDAAIGVLPSAARINGNITVQRFMTKEGWNNTRIYRYISSPVQNATVSDIQNEITITGSFTGTSVCSGCGTAQSMFAYDESVITDTNGSGVADYNDGYVDFPSTTNAETLTPGRGYTLFVRGNVLPSTSWDVRGPVNAGNITAVSLPVTFTPSGNTANDGWNLVGNPFPSTIDWNAASGWTKTNINGSIYCTDNGSSTTTQYATWNGTTGTNGGSRYIATGQAFWVKANAAPVLTANENVKVPGTQTIFFREGAVDDLIRITLSKASVRDEAVIHFRQDATGNFDTQADAEKLPNNTFNLSSVQPDGKKYAINSIPSFACSSSVNLSVENIAVGTYQLTFSEYESFRDRAVITLHDNFTSSDFDVIGGGSYEFSVTSNAGSYGPGRFVLSFTRAELNTDLVINPDRVCEGSNAVVTIDNPQNGAIYSLQSVNDHVPLSAPQTGEGSPLSFAIPADSLTIGQNNFIIKAAWENCASVAEIGFHFTMEENPEAPSAEGGATCREGVVTLHASSNSENASYNWYETETSSSPDSLQHASVFVTPLLTKSKTYFVSAVSLSGCEGPRTSVPATVVYYDEAQITVTIDGDSLQSNYSSGNQWYINDNLIPGATTRTILADASGKYRVDVSIGGCVTSADYNYIITQTDHNLRDIITVFPNPVTDVLKIEIPASFDDIEQARIVNAYGQITGTIELNLTGNIRSGQFDMRKYAAGIYILQIVFKEKVIEIKIIKEK